jgi:hypothetical protein
MWTQCADSLGAVQQCLHGYSPDSAAFLEPLKFVAPPRQPWLNFVCRHQQSGSEALGLILLSAVGSGRAIMQHEMSALMRRIEAAPGHVAALRAQYDDRPFGSSHGEGVEPGVERTYSCNKGASCL